MKSICKSFAFVIMFFTIHQGFAASAIICSGCLSFVECLEQSINYGGDLLYEANMCVDKLSSGNPMMEMVLRDLVNQELDQIVQQLINEQTKNEICAQLRLCETSGGGTDPCPECENCVSTGWSSSSTGYQMRKVATCNCGVCNYTNHYRCDYGFYGSAGNGDSGCSKCPDVNISGVISTSLPGSTQISNCFIPSGMKTSDNRGDYSYESDCYYAQ